MAEAIGTLGLPPVTGGYGVLTPGCLSVQQLEAFPPWTAERQKENP
jgi:hypothetical protein